MSQEGILYGIGVGPGEPDYLTIKAAKILKEVSVVFTAASPGNDYSIAQNIAQPHLNDKVEIIRLDFPMVGDKSVLEKAWEKNALQIIEVLKSGRSAAFLTLGDPSTYSTYSYVLPFIAKLAPSLKVITIPGITSYQMAAAKLNRPLVTGLQSFSVMSGVEDPKVLSELLDKSDNVVILKTYRSYKRIVKMLEEKGLADKAVLCSKLGLADENIKIGLAGESDFEPPYLSLMVIKKGE